ncbi:MAG: Fe-S cluster assembly ATPase SufC [bacterium]|nr:Fe-S cluster assembly ATPase SufC [bacterium]
MKLIIKDLQTKVDNKIVLNNFNLTINDKEIHAIMGKNGIGKSTLAKTIMGYPEYIIQQGDIICNSSSILNLPINERSKLGIFLSHQNPLEIDGITNIEFLKSIAKNNNTSYHEFIKEVKELSNKLDLKDDILNRQLNIGFSGGEKKKNEILQLNLLKPKLIILDELDSGLDIDALQIVCKSIIEYKKNNPNTSIIIITHYPRILKFLKPNYVHILSGGKISKTADYKLAEFIENNGYDKTNIMEENSNYE